MSVGRQILLRMSAVLAFCLVVVAVATSLLSIQQTRELREKDYATYLHQTALQMNYLLEDIHSFAIHMAVDELLQEAMFGPASSRYTYGGLVYRTRNRLKDYKAQRDSIQSIALITASNDVIWEVNLYDSYFTDQLEESWFQEVKETDRPVCTAPHMLAGSANYLQEVISYVVPVYSINKPDTARAYLIINVDAGHFLSYIRQTDTDFAAVAWRQGERLIYATESTLPVELWGNLISASIGDTVLYASYDHSLDGYITVQSFSLLLVIILLLLITGFLVMIPVAKGITRPLAELTSVMSRAAAEGMERMPAPAYINARQTAEEIRILSGVFGKMLEELHRRMEQRIDDERKIQRLRTEIVLSQVNPHFLYNTLNSVIFLSRKYKAQDIEQITQSLISLLQQSITFENREALQTLRQELQLVEQYATIQSYRYTGMFALELQVPPRLLDRQVPRFLLQPLVENAIFHGINPKGEPGLIVLAAWEDEAYFYLSVRDDGVGMEQERAEALETADCQPDLPAGRASIGLRNVRQRLRQLYGDGAALRIITAPGRGCEVRLEIPLSYSERA